MEFGVWGLGFSEHDERERLTSKPSSERALSPTRARDRDSIAGYCGDDGRNLLVLGWQAVVGASKL